MLQSRILLESRPVVNGSWPVVRRTFWHARRYSSPLSGALTRLKVLCVTCVLQPAQIENSSKLLDGSESKLVHTLALFLHHI